MVWLVVIFSLAAVALMALALSITRLRKGRDIQGEVGTNPHMQRLGLECPARQHDNCTTKNKCATCTKNCDYGSST